MGTLGGKRLKEAQINRMPAFTHEANTKNIHEEEMLAFGTEARLEREKKFLKKTATLFVRDKYNRHFSYVKCNDISIRSLRSFDKFIIQI